MQTMQNELEALQPAITEAEAEVARLEAQAAKAAPAEMAKLASLIVASRMKLDLLTGRQARAKAQQQAEAAQRETEQKEVTHKQAVKVLQERKEKAEADWKVWTRSAEKLEDCAKALWQERDRLQGEVAAVFATDKALEGRLGSVDIPSGAGEFEGRCRLPNSFLRFFPYKGINR
jgi:chromosome segregation ATPase